MTDVQSGVMAWAALAVLGVLGHNLWLLWRHRPLRPVPKSPATPSERPEGAVPLSERLAHGAPDNRHTHLDPLIDSMVVLLPEQPIAGEALLPWLPRVRRVGSKPFLIEAYNMASHVWEPPQAGARYRSVQTGVQLANRSGALTEIEFSEFIGRTQQLADRLHAHIDFFPDMADEIARARELDRFASAHDAKIVFKIRASRAAWSPGYLVQQAEQLGWVHGALPGRVVLPARNDPQGHPRLTLRFATQAAFEEDLHHQVLTECELWLDVPQVARSEQAYLDLCNSAQSLASALEGRLTDGQGVPLTPQVLEQVGQDLEQLYAALETRDLAAGSWVARRLFS